MIKRMDLGAVSAYALAVEQGYKGTEEEFVEILTNALNYATQAQESASAAAGSAEEAGRYKTQAGEILANVNLSGTQQIEAIEAAGTQQTNAAKEAIEAKGKETLDSIPNSYEALQGDVTQLRGDLDDRICDNKLFNGDFSHISSAGNSSVEVISEIIRIDVNEGDVLNWSFADNVTDYQDTISKKGIRLTPRLDGTIKSRLIKEDKKGSYTVPNNINSVGVALYFSLPNGNTRGYSFGIESLSLWIGDALYSLSPKVDVYKEIKQNTQHIESLDVRVRSLEEGTIPTYYSEYLNDKITEIQNKNLLSGRNGDSFIFVTDTHTPSNNGYSTLLAKAISDKTNNSFIVFGGDILTQSHTREQALAIERNYIHGLRESFGTDYRYVFGNHEYNTMASVDDSEKLNADDVYAICVKPFEDVVSIYGTTDTERFIYYWDNPSQKIRYIVLNTGVNVQYAGNYLPLDNILRSTPNGYRVGVFTHSMINGSGVPTTSGAYVLGMLDAVNGRTSYTFCSKTYDYSNLDIEIMFVMCGHTHKDISHLSEHGVPVICTTTDSKLDGLKIDGTIDEQAFDVVDVDCTNRKIYCTRIGLGDDREFSWNVAN